MTALDGEAHRGLDPEGGFVLAERRRPVFEPLRGFRALPVPGEGLGPLRRIGPRQAVAHGGRARAQGFGPFERGPSVGQAPRSTAASPSVIATPNSSEGGGRGGRISDDCGRGLLGSRGGRGVDRARGEWLVA